MKNQSVEEAKEGISTDVLIYLENRFDGIENRQKEVNKVLFEKLSEINKTTNENLTVAKNQNSRIFKLEEKHEKCPGAVAIENQKIKNAEDIIKGKKSYKVGELFVTSATAAGIIGAIWGLIKLF